VLAVEPEARPVVGADRGDRGVVECREIDAERDVVDGVGALRPGVEDEAQEVLALGRRSNWSSVGTTLTTASRSILAGWSSARRYATRAPRSWPTTDTRSIPSLTSSSTRSAASSRFV
jgi:hypothetical protein